MGEKSFIWMSSLINNGRNYMDEFINALREDMGYDYIANNAHKFSKEELKRIILELLYELTNETHKPNIENAIEELEEFFAD
jgi:hypothetical protein